jgi:hypothetical protein
VKFRRKSDQADSGADSGVDTAPEVATGIDAAEWSDVGAAGTGPFDVDDVKGDGVTRVDLGSLLLVPEAGRELRLQVDERTQEVAAVVLAGADGALELRAFSAPRNGDLWSDVRPQLAADMARRGGTATEREGRFGTELVCQLSVTTPDGRAAQQPSRIIGINGPRWMLRATLLGRPALNPEAASEWEDTLASVVVRRGEHAMPVGDPLPVVLPSDARKVDTPRAEDLPSPQEPPASRG